MLDSSPLEPQELWDQSAKLRAFAQEARKVDFSEKSLLFEILTTNQI